MPCDQVRTTTVQWTEATDVKLVAQAMEAIGLREVTVESYARGTVVSAWDQTGDNRVLFQNGRLTFVRGGLDEEALKQRYAAEVVQERFRALGWSVEEQGKVQTVAAGFTRSWD